MIYGDGKQTRDFTSVADAVLGTLLAGASKSMLSGEALNIGSGRSTSVVELARIMGERAGVSGVEATHEPDRKGDVPHALADWSRARDLIGFEPTHRLEDAIVETIAYYRAAIARTT